MGTLASLKAAWAASRAKAASRTHCGAGHALTPDNVSIRPGTNWRSCIVCKRLRKRKESQSNVSASLARKIVAAVYDGDTKLKIQRRFGYTVFTRLFAHNPKLATIIKPKLEASRLQSYAQRPQCRRSTIAAPALLKNNGAEAFDAIQSATRHLPEPMRGAIQSDLWLAVAEGRETMRDIPGAVKAAITAHNRNEKHSVMSRWGNRSLDAPMGDDGFSLLDTPPDQGAWSPVALNTGRHVSTRNWI